MSWKKVLNIVVTVLIFVAMGYVLYRNLNELVSYDFSVSWLSLGISFVFLWGFLVLWAVSWWEVVKGLGHKIGFWRMLHVKLVSDVSRFLPGKLWYFARRAQLAKKYGVPYGMTVYSVVLETVLGIVASTLLFLVALFYIGESLPGYVIAVALAIPLGFVFFNPRTITWLVNLGLKKFKRKPMDVDIMVIDIAKMTAWFGLAFGVLGIGFYFMANAVYPISLIKAPLLMAVFLGSWVIGYFGIVTPGGLGVREGALSFFLSLFMPVSIAIVISLLSRVWWIAGEAVIVLLFLKSPK